MILLALMTLRRGAKEGAILLLATCLPVIMLSHWYVQPLMWKLQLASQVAVWLMALLLRTTASWTLLLELIAVCGVILIAALHAIYPEIASFWQQYLLTTLKGIQVNGPEMFAKLDVGQLQWLSGNFAKIASGAFMTELVFSNLVILALARYLQASLYNPGGLKKELYYVHFSIIPVVLTLILLSLAWLAKVSFLQDSTLILLLPFICAGLSLVHWSSASLKGQTYYLIGFYVLMVLLFLQVIAALILAGMADAIFNFRNRSVAALKR